MARFACALPDNGAVMIARSTIELAVFADYFQFYLLDCATNEDFGALWTEEAVERLLAVAPHAVGIGTARNMQVPVAISVHDREPEADFPEWEQVHDCSLTVVSGRVAILGATDYLPDAPSLALAPGPYRARISYAGLETLSEDGLEGDDFYRIQLWPAPLAALLTRKQRAGAAD